MEEKQGGINNISKPNTSEQYPLWKLRVRALLDKDEVGDALIPVEDASAQTAAWQKRNAKAKAIITLTLGDAALITIAHEKEATAAEIWKTLQKEFQPNTIHSKIILRKTLFGMKLNLKEGSCPVKDFAHFLQEFRATAAKLAAIGAGISEADQAIALLSTLPDSFSPLIMSLSSTTTDPGLSHVTTMIQQEVKRRKEEKRGITLTQTSFNTALAVTKTSRSRSKNKCNNVSTRSTYQAGTKKYCIGCGKENHFWVHCFHNPDRVGISSQRTTDRKTPYGSAQLRIRHDQAPASVNRARSLTLESDAESSDEEREDFLLNRQDPGKARHTIADQSARSDKIVNNLGLRCDGKLFLRRTHV
jgi:hypothetical protein